MPKLHVGTLVPTTQTRIFVLAIMQPIQISNKYTVKYTKVNENIFQL